MKASLQESITMLVLKNMFITNDVLSSINFPSLGLLHLANNRYSKDLFTSLDHKLNKLKALTIDSNLS